MSYSASEARHAMKSITPNIVSFPFGHSHNSGSLTLTPPLDYPYDK